MTLSLSDLSSSNLTLADLSCAKLHRTNIHRALTKDAVMNGADVSTVKTTDRARLEAEAFVPPKNLGLSGES